MGGSEKQTVKFGETSKPYKGMTVLIADGFENMRATMSTILSEAGFDRILQAPDGESVLKILQHSKVDLIIASRQLPKIDGLEILRKVRANPKTARTPFIMTSGNIEQEEVVAAIKSGVSEFVIKPFSPKILMDRIVRGMERPTHVKCGLKGEAEAKIKILVVDDVPDNIHIIGEILCKKYSIKAANSGEKALKICRSDNQPDLVLLDIMMPEMDGMEVCKRLKAHPGTQHISVIFLTALDQSDQVVKGFDLGAVDYITKPFSPAVVEARVGAHCKGIESNRMLRYQVDLMLENSRLKEDFDRVLQNDLKQPISEMMKTVDLVKRYAKNPNKVLENADILTASCEKVSKVVDSMLLVGQVEDGGYELTPEHFGLIGVINDVIASLAPSVKEKVLEVSVDALSGDCQAFGEAPLSRSMFSCLIKNSVEAAPRGSAITITVEKINSYVRITIHNLGFIPEEIHKTFFDKYVSHGKKDAMGIGAYLAKLLANIQGGKIGFKTSIDKGTDVIVNLPI